MVWFQCEDCGDNLKKPKLPNHFRTCSASKLSCIDCGQMFGQESVQGHTQCITEAEKYGPKGQGGAKSVTTPKSNKDSKQLPDFDIFVGLSERPPWFCSLCNTQATSKQTLLLHAEGKKHKGKARGYHAANKQPNKTEETVPDKDLLVEVVDNGQAGEGKMVDQLEAKGALGNLEAENGTSHSKKKRKYDSSEDEGIKKKTRDSDPSKGGHGEVIQGERTAPTKTEIKPMKDGVQESKKKIKWKKLITSILKSNPDGVLKLKKLTKLTLKSLRESGIAEDETKLIDTLEQEINASSKFTIEKKYVRLAAKA